MCISVEGSQPPFLSRMVRAIFSATDDLKLATRALPLLLVEHDFWVTGDLSLSFHLLIYHTGSVGTVPIRYILQVNSPFEFMQALM